VTAEVFIRCGPGERRIVLTENGKLSRVLIDRDHEPSLVGAVYAGRIASVVKGLNAAFVELDGDLTGFLAAPDAQVFDRQREKPKPIDTLFNEGDAVLVQVSRDGFDGKGPKLTTRIDLASENLILSVARPGLNISQKIQDVATRDRLEGLFEPVLPTDAGLIVRTRAADAEDAVLEKEAAALTGKWAEIKEADEAAETTQCLLPPPPAALAFLADHYDLGLTRIVLDDRKMANDLTMACEEKLPGLASLISREEGGRLFETHDLDDQWAALLQPVVSLPGGGKLIIEETAALTAIDIDSGPKESGARPEDHNLRINLEAAGEILRHIALREISGQIMVDFLPQRDPENREEIAAELDALSGPLRRELNFFGFTRLGLFEMTRRRRRPSLTQTLFAADGRNLSPVTIALDALYRVRQETANHPGQSPALEAPEDVTRTLETGIVSPARRELEAKIGLTIELRAQKSHPAAGFDLTFGKPAT
jgi:ribonuclease G